VVERLFRELRRAVERVSGLKHGQAFLPKSLRGKRLSGSGLRPAVRNVARALGMEVREQVSNPFPKAYEIGWQRQIVDYVLESEGVDHIYLELETLDRAQLSTFMDPPAMRGRHSLNKLWYYYVTLAERRLGNRRGPSIFAFLRSP
jgi:hypothetical protein